MVTQVETAPAPILYLGAAPVLYLGIDSYFNRISAILKKHAARETPIAMTLSNWGIEICDLILTLKGKALLVALAQKIHELRYKHLVGCMDNAPLEKAFVSHERLWDEWMLRHYLKVDPKNGTPFPLEESLALAEAEPLANELIECMKEMLKPDQSEVLSELAELVNLLPPPDTRRLDPSKTQAAADCVALRGYQEIADCILEQEQQKDLGTFFEKKLQSSKRETMAAEKQNLKNATIVRDALTGIERFVTTSLDFIETSHARTVASMQAQLELEREENRNLEKAIRAVEERARVLEARLDQAFARIRDLDAQNQANAAAANSNSGGGCSIM